MKKMLCLVGESGSGKTTIAEALEQKGYKVLPSYTTRPKRHEREEHHVFVTPEEFQQIKNELIAYTLFNEHEYGATTKQFAEFDIYVIDLNGLKNLVNQNGKDICCSIYLSTTEEVRVQRLTETRGEKDANNRIKHDREAFKEAKKYNFDFILPNNTLEQFRKNVTIIDVILKEIKTNEHL